MSTPTQSLITTALAGALAICAPASGQVSHDQVVVSSYRSPTVGEQGGLWLVESSTGVVTPVTGLSEDLTGGSSPVSKGANSVLLGPEGELYVGEVGPPGTEIDLHRITLSGNAVASDELLWVGTSTATYGGSIQQTALLPDGRILVGVSGLGAGPLAGHGLGIVDFASGTVTAVPVDTVPPQLPVTNALCLGPDGQVAYFVFDNGGGTVNLFSVPIPDGGTATYHTTLCALVSGLMLDRAGNRLIATSQQLGACAGSLIEIELGTFAWSTCGDWDALNALAPDGSGGLFVATQTLGSPPASLLAMGAPPNCSATTVTGGPAGGWSQPSGMDTLYRNISRSYCFGDGRETPCPCGNESAQGAGEGCANSTGVGALLEATGTLSASQDDMGFMASHLLPNQPALLFAGHNAVNGGDGINFGDGLRCAGGSVVRLGVRVPDGAGGASWGPGLGATGGWSAGDTRRFQTWYRDPGSGSPCGAGFNLSNGVEVVFSP